MIFVKTQAGQQAFKERQGAVMAPRQRSAFLLCDGRRTLQEVLAATAAMGITAEDVEALVRRGLLQSADTAAAPRAPQTLAPTEEAGTHAGTPAVRAAGRTPAERYQAACPIATELTAALGLRGFRLNLAVEAASGYDELCQLAPKIREAVGEDRYARLARALFA